VDHGANPVSVLRQPRIQLVGMNEVGELPLLQVAPLVPLSKPVRDHDSRLSAILELGHDVGADETGSTRDQDQLFRHSLAAGVGATPGWASGGRIV